MSTSVVALRVGLIVLALAAGAVCARSLWTALQWRRPSWKLPAAIALMALLGNLPWTVDRLVGSAADQYGQLYRAADGSYLGSLVIPLSGSYTLYSEGESPIGLQIAGREIFGGQRMTSRHLAAGEYPMTVRYSNGNPARLWWITPGGSMYKQPIPVDYLLSSPPRDWQRFRLFWRHYVWLWWIPTGLLVCVWLIAPATGTAPEPGS